MPFPSYYMRIVYMHIVRGEGQGRFESLSPYPQTLNPYKAVNRTTASNLLEAVDSTVNCAFVFLRGNMEPTGARSFDHLGWIDAQFRSFTKFDALLIKELLIGTPALELSKQSSGFISRFSADKVADAEVLLDDITQGLEIHWLETAEKLEDNLATLDRLGNDFWKYGEFASMVISHTASPAIKPLLKEIEESKTARAEQKAKLVLRKYEKVDTFFRHIRNALAHGSFKRIETTPVALYAFQDENQYGFISARMVISEEHLRNIITSIYEFEKKGI